MARVREWLGRDGDCDAVRDAAKEWNKRRGGPDKIFLVIHQWRPGIDECNMGYVYRDPKFRESNGVCLAVMAYGGGPMGPDFRLAVRDDGGVTLIYHDSVHPVEFVTEEDKAAAIALIKISVPF